MVIAAVVVIVLPFLLPTKFSAGPKWLFPLIEAGLLAAMLVVDPGRIDKHSATIHRIRLAFISALVLGAGWAATWLTVDIIRGGKLTNSPGKLLAAGAVVLTDMAISFAFLYWELADGGPGERAHEKRAYPDFGFPQHMNPELAPLGWQPQFVDFLYLAITNSIAFSPTDVMPLARWAKLAMAAQSVAALAMFGLVIARAVNVLQ